MMTAEKRWSGSDTRIACGIRQALAQRHAMTLGQLAGGLASDVDTVRWAVQDLLREGVVERLRPVGCGREELDFFRIKSAAGGAPGAARPLDRVTTRGHAENVCAA
jgi:predicted ArsR family transcriptional regulator